MLYRYFCFRVWGALGVSTQLLALLLLTLLPFSLSAQTRSAVPAPTKNATPETQNSTRAVVVGISEYQHKSIPDLQFADRDAKAFADWLASEAGGRVPADSIIVLLNNDATAGKVISALDGLAESPEEGGLVFIYFSGHGDIEKVTTRQNGYLLCHDAPATTYPAGGCLPLAYLQDIVSTISEKKGRVVLVTDACHAGKLAGSTINGTQTTNAALARQFANEVKIMSCQASELALEGEQWGAGRGLFSFHLVDGLTGLADMDTNRTVTLREIGRYLEDHVTAEAAPHPQTPVVLGERSFPLAQVDAALLKSLPKPDNQSFTKTEMRGLFSGADSVLYHAFESALIRRDFFEPAGNCAEFFYQKLLQSQALRPMQGLVRRNYAAALMDEIQQAINALLDNDPYEANTWQYNPEKYSRYPDYLQRTIELLGEKHYMYASLMSKKHYFEGYNIAKTLAIHEQQPERRAALRERAKQHYLEAIGLDPDAAYLYHAIGDMYYADAPYQTDSLMLWCSRAAEASPGWVTPLLRISDELVNAQGQFAKSETWIRSALQILPESYLVQEKLSFLYYYMDRREEAFGLAQKMIAEKPDLFNAYTLMVFLHFFLDGDFPTTEAYTQKSAERNPSPNNWALNWWAGSQIYLHPLPEAVERIKRSIEGSTGIERGYRGAFLIEALAMAKRYDEADSLAHQLLAENLPPYIQTNILQKHGKMRVRQNRLADADAFFRKSLAADPTPDPMFISDYAWLGELARLQHRPAEAENFFKQALAYNSGFGEDRLYKDEACYLYGNFLLRQKRLPEAAQQFQQSLDLRRKGFWGEYGFALLAAKQGKNQEALDWLEKALDNFFPDSEAVLEEPLFAKLRKTTRFKSLLAKHFPETAKH